MITNINEAAKKAINQGKQLKAVVEVGEFLEEIGNLEQLAVEAERHAKEAVEKRARDLEALQQVQDQLRDANVSHQLASDQYAREETLAAQAALDTDMQTRIAVHNIIVEAKETALQLVATATAEVELLTATSTELQTQVTKLESKLTKVRADMRELKDGLG